MTGPRRGGGDRPAAAREDRIASALRWTASVLEDLDVRWVVAGGLAARAHGATRELHDIDLYVEEGALERILPAVREHHAHGPRRYRDEHWDCLFLEVRYAGEEIELAEAARCRHRAGPDAPWHPAGVEFHRAVRRAVFGVEVPVMPRAALVAYKRRLDREVDRRDLEELR